ncbi:MAG TPA: PEP/pyruvate-binding domain-containing protein [Acidimicrobiales bacterium]|nr:PEP/pyruvate-binding domain-containing protein [Acidimicrobiales bacterium]
MPTVARNQPGVVRLDDPAATEPGLTGAKAAALAKATVAGLPVLPGMVLTTASALPTNDLRRAWVDVSQEGRRSLVVRSSSVAEDGATSSMAGQFTSVLDVRDWPSFVEAVHEVAESGGDGMAVLVQPFLDPVYGGVLFGADPVTARRDRVVVAVVHGGPHRLVHGQVSGDRWTLTAHGRVVSHEGGPDEVALGYRPRRELAGLARRAAALLGGPQDIEWAFDRARKLWLLQSRPITALAPTAGGPVYGPGPVAETFPEALAPLEEDLWLDPLRVALVEALSLTGAASRRTLRERPLVISVGGRVAADLTALGEVKPTRPFVAKLDPRPPARRLVAAWRVGRLRAALPALARDLVEGIDNRLADVPHVSTLTDDELLTLLERSRQALLSMHGHEVLAGLLIRSPGELRTTAASVALQAVARGRAEGLSDGELVVRDPVALVLTPPRVGPPAPLPDVEPTAGSAAGGDPGDPSLAREALRTRVRWLQELTGRAAWELGRRLSRRGVLVDPADVRQLHLDELTAAVAARALRVEAVTRAAPPAPPLPARFGLSHDGVVVPIAGHRGEGVGAGGGRGAGSVHVVDEGRPPDGAVLVVAHLEPHLAPLLPRLSGLIAETGSPLSHLAILAREYGVPVVVGVPDARVRYPTGTSVVVDGTTGEVAVT